MTDISLDDLIKQDKQTGKVQHKKKVHLGLV